MVGLDFSDITWVYPSSPLDTIAANSRYRLTVAVGQAVPWDTADAIISLLAGTTIVGSTTIKADNISEGTFRDYTTSFDAEIGSPLVGLPLSLELRADRAGRPLRPPPGEQPLWVFFDNVRLTSEALPEPGTLTMIASLGAILLCRRKVRRAPA
jgi:hypothetical protein